jgi:hypothetical protein
VCACVNGVDRGHFMITHPRNVDVLDSFPKRGRPRFEFPVDRGPKPTLIPQVKFLPKIGRVHNLYMLYRLCACAVFSRREPSYFSVICGTLLHGKKSGVSSQRHLVVVDCKSPRFSDL